MNHQIVMGSRSSSDSSRNWSYDVFPSFSGEDVRKTFLSHFLNELGRKAIVAFKDNGIERGESIAPMLIKGINESRVAVVVFSINYASSSWCLNELLEILKCKEKNGQKVIPIFYELDPSHLRQLSGDFGTAFEKTCKRTKGKMTCKNQAEEVINQWKQALTDAANIFGYHFTNWESDATMIEQICSDILGRLNLIPPNDFKECVGIEDRIIDTRLMLNLESKEVRMVGIWGMSGIGKTTIARALYNNISSQFQLRGYIDRGFISKCREGFGRAKFYDHNMKLRLREEFLSEIMEHENMKNASIEERLKHQKVLVVIDDLDDPEVLNALAGKTQWFGNGSRIIVVTTDKNLLRAHGIKVTYKVDLPSYGLAVDIFCLAAFKQKSPPAGLIEFTNEVVQLAGLLPLGLRILGLSFRGKDKEDCLKSLPRLRKSLDGEIENTLRVSYEGLGSEEDKKIFRHIACLFNHKKKQDIKLYLADSVLGFDIGLKNLVHRSLIEVERDEVVRMNRLLQDTGKAIVRKQYPDEPGKREFLVDPKDIRDVLEENTGTHRVLGISLETSDIDKFGVHESAFKRMHNLRFLKVYTKLPIGSNDYLPPKLNKLELPESFDHLPPKLKYLHWSDYPMRCMPSRFRPESLLKFEMPNSKLEKLWEGVVSLPCLKKMDLRGSTYLKEVPDLSLAPNLEELNLAHCSRLEEFPSSIRGILKLRILNLSFCTNLDSLPTDVKLRSLKFLHLRECSRLKSFPDISMDVSHLDLRGTAIEEVPWWIKYFSELSTLCVSGCSKLEYVHDNYYRLDQMGGALFDCDALIKVFRDEASTGDDWTKEDSSFYVHYKLKQSFISKSRECPSEEVPSYFTHRTSVTNILHLHTDLSQTFVRFEVGVVVSFKSTFRTDFSRFKLSWEFKGKFGDAFDRACRRPHTFIRYKEDSLHIVECCIPLNEIKDNKKDQVDMKIEIRVPDDVKLKGLGVRLLDQECKYCAGDTERRADEEMRERAAKRPRLCGPSSIPKEGDAEEEYAEEGDTEIL